tara:strand:+ start:79 stop:357 length:279 start_codon:yes stop_codon:yes gene_type:complete
MAANSIYNNGGANLMAFGQHGGAYATGGVTVPDGMVVVAVTSLDDTTEFTSADTGFPQINNVAIPRGVTIYGRWSTITIDGSSGKAIVYFGP